MKQLILGNDNKTVGNGKTTQKQGNWFRRNAEKMIFLALTDLVLATSFTAGCYRSYCTCTHMETAIGLKAAAKQTDEFKKSGSDCEFKLEIILLEDAIRDLKSDDPEKRDLAVHYVSRLDEDGEDISSAMHALITELKRYDSNKLWICSTFEKMADQGLDISAAEQALIDVADAKDGPYLAADVAAEALTKHYVNKKEWDKVKTLLNHVNAEVRSRTALALGDEASKGEDITPTEAGLTGIINNERFGWGKKAAARALTNNYLRNDQTEKANELLNHPNGPVAQGAELGRQEYKEYKNKFESK